MTVSIDLANYENLYRNYVTSEICDQVKSLKLRFDLSLHNTKSKELFKYQTSVLEVTIGDVLKATGMPIDLNLINGIKNKVLSSAMLSCIKSRLIKLISPLLEVTTEGLNVIGLGKVVNSMLRKDQAPRTLVKKSHLKSKSGAIFPFKMMAKFVKKIKEPAVAKRRAKELKQPVEPVDPTNILTEYEYLSFYNQYSFSYLGYRVNVSVKVIPAASLVKRPSLLVSVYM